MKEFIQRVLNAMGRQTGRQQHARSSEERNQEPLTEVGASSEDGGVISQQVCGQILQEQDVWPSMPCFDVSSVPQVRNPCTWKSESSQATSKVGCLLVSVRGREAAEDAVN